jgi:hypothetical protein
LLSDWLDQVRPDPEKRYNIKAINTRMRRLAFIRVDTISVATNGLATGTYIQCFSDGANAASFPFPYYCSWSGILGNFAAQRARGITAGQEKIPVERRQSRRDGATASGSRLRGYNGWRGLWLFDERLIWRIPIAVE